MEEEEGFGEGTEFGPEGEVFGGVPETVDCSVFDLTDELWCGVMIGCDGGDNMVCHERYYEKNARESGYGRNDGRE